MSNEQLIERIIAKKVEKEKAREAKNAALVAAGKKPFKNRKIYPPVTETQIVASEKKLGFKLPPFLRELYLKVGNGGFGPGSGILGIEGGYTDDNDRDCVSLYLKYDEPFEGGPSIWPKNHLLFCYWGDTIYSVLDCGKSPAPVYMIEFGNVNFEGKVSASTITDQYRPHKPTLEEWFTDWVDAKDLWKQIYKS